MPKNNETKQKAQDITSIIKHLEEKLQLTEDQKIIDVEFVDTINLGGDLNRNSVFAVKVQNKNKEITHIIIDKEANKVADIDKDGRIKLSEKEIEKWQQFIGKPEKQTPEQKKRYDFEKEYILQEYKTNEKTVRSEESAVPQDEGKNVGACRGDHWSSDARSKDTEKQKAAEALNTDETAIIAMIKIEDRETFGQAINKKLHADAYIVRYGNNKTKIMQMNSKGKLTELEGLESNEFNLEVLEQLNLDKTSKSQKIKSGDLTTIRTEDPKSSYVVVREHDSKNGIVIVTSGNKTQMYTFDDEGKDNIKEIETSIKYRINNDETGNDENDGKSVGVGVPDDSQNNEKDVENEESVVPNDERGNDDEDEGKTPWGDAYARQRR